MTGGQETGDIPRFSDFADEKKRLEGTKIRVADLINKEIRITGYSIDPSKFPTKDGGSKNRLMLEFVLDGEQHVTFTGSEVLIAQILKYQDKIPFYATIKHIDRYYTFG
ncbi:MAG TPA: hypothetical protein PLA39_07885 [Methanoculleus sp.]|nr:hypothetical protein [Methanoculleus sp.]